MRLVLRRQEYRLAMLRNVVEVGLPLHKDMRR